MFCCQPYPRPSEVFFVIAQSYFFIFKNLFPHRGSAAENGYLPSAIESVLMEVPLKCFKKVYIITHSVAVFLS